MRTLKLYLALGLTTVAPGFFAHAQGTGGSPAAITTTTPIQNIVVIFDENISFETMAGLVGSDLAARLRDLTLEIYTTAARYAESKDIIIADTKFEFGFVDGELVLGDEVLTPDSSRFWPADSYTPGGPQDSYDKQFVRDYLESIHWNKQPPTPPLTEEVAAKTSEKYRQAYSVLTGHSL